MTAPENPPAFPRPSSGHQSSQTGMSLRDYFAGQALHTMRGIAGMEESTIQWAASEAYAIADALLAARKEASHE